MKESIFCPAKINLFLEVLDKRDDGYHDIDTVMQSVTLFDKVSVCIESAKGTGSIVVKCDKEGVPSLESSESNIVYKAARLFFQKAGIDASAYDLEIEIEKQIPVCAGLGGGSTDAAGVLILLDLMLNVYMGRDKLAQISAELGADVPFCVLGGAYRGVGIGTTLERVPSLSTELFICIAKGGSKVSTGHAYSMMDARSEEKRTSDKLISALEKEDLAEIGYELFNAFQFVNDTDAVNNAISVMKKCGALGACLSGSGPSVFGIFFSIDDADNAMKSLWAMGYEAFVASPVR